MMAWYIWILLGVYILGFGLTLWFHVEMAPNATLGLILIRCLLWPLYWAFGWPGGVPLPMD